MDFTSPDPVLLSYVTILSPCLSSGPLQAMSGLVFDVNNSAGVFEIDTAFFPPGSAFEFRDCGTGQIITPDFTKGVLSRIR